MARVLKTPLFRRAGRWVGSVGRPNGLAGFGR